MPCEITNKQLKDDLCQKIEDGIYSAGEIIAPKKFRKLTCKENNSPTIEEYTVAGRKIPLDTICKKFYIKNKMLYRLFINNEIDGFNREVVIRELDRMDELKTEHLNLETCTLREIFRKFNTSRNLMFWHDGSCISNHSHFLSEDLA